MDLSDYQRLLLKHALYIMACDGDVDAREVQEIRRFTTDTPFFDGLDVEQELTTALNELNSGGAAAIEAALQELPDQQVNDRQRQRLLDVLLQVVDADGAVQDSERVYLQRVRAALKVPVEEVARRYADRFALFVPGATAAFGAASSFALPAALPAAPDFFRE
jgi:uncharacterized tellurite resistance protein B-like protein